MFAAGAARDVVDDDRQPRRLRDRAEVREHSALRRLVVVGNDGKNRVGAGRLRLLRTAATDSRVAFVPALATTTARLPTASFTAVHSATRSPRSSVCPSPVEPATTSPSFPRSTSQRASRCASRRSSAPCSSNGVTIAVRIVPRFMTSCSPLPRWNCSCTALSARVDVIGRYEHRDRDVAVGAVNDLHVGARERFDDVVDDAGRVAHARADDRELRAAFAHAHGEIQVAEQAPQLVAAIAFDHERHAGLIDRHLIDRDLRLGDAPEHLELGLHAPRRRFDVAPNNAHPRHTARRRYAR